MARVSFKVGDDVAVVGRDGGAASRITRITNDWGDGWFTAGGPNETREWSKTGLSRDDRFPGWRIVPVTDEHRRALHIRGLRTKLAREHWHSVPDETIEAVAKLLGWTENGASDV